MKFSYRSNKFLTLQKERGHFWVDKLGATGPANIMSQRAFIEKQRIPWHMEASKLFSDIFKVSINEGENFAGQEKSGKIENLFFCNDVTKRSKEWMDSQSEISFGRAIEAIIEKHNFFGSVILDNKRSIVFGIYSDKIIAVTLEYDLISNIESISDISTNGCVYSSLLADFVDLAEVETELQSMYSMLDTTSPFLNLIPLLVIYFFAKVETHVIQDGKSKRVIVDKDKYINETQVPVKIINSKWFTNIIRLEGFSVRGHFRLQPKKVNGEWRKELIWINDFEKHGYTSKARILNQED